jgi:flagella basal body P-ring formation protein FlgA
MGAGARTVLSGSAHRYVEIPVLANRVEVGAIIGEPDFEWIEQRADKVRRNVVTDSSELVGLSARRRIRVGEPIRARDVQRPIVIAKGDLVTLVMQTENIAARDHRPGHRERRLGRSHRHIEHRIPPRRARHCQKPDARPCAPQGAPLGRRQVGA